MLHVLLMRRQNKSPPPWKDPLFVVRSIDHVYSEHDEKEKTKEYSAGNAALAA